MTLAGRSRMNLAGPETLHMAHVLKEMDRGFFSGKNHKGWKGHVLGAEGEEGNCEERPNTVVNFCSRLEFQDGKRKPKGQQYHGRGTVHLHSLDFLQNKATIKLETKIAAVEPTEEEPLLRGIVLDSQRGRSRSQVAVREEPSIWDDEAGRVRLQHKEGDFQKHIRAYFRESMEVTKCHKDVQMADGRHNLLRYVATYAPKFSGSFAKDWLNDDASDYSVARRVAFDYHPLEPEMWLTLAGQLFPQVSYGGTEADRRALPRHGREAELRRGRHHPVPEEGLRQAEFVGGVRKGLQTSRSETHRSCHSQPASGPLLRPVDGPPHPFPES